MVKLLLIVAVCLAVFGGIGWAVIAELETHPAPRAEQPAIVFRAPDGFDLKELGASSLASAAEALRAHPSVQSGVEFSDNGDPTILLADRDAQRIVEIRSFHRRTIVERVWQADVDHRLDWAIENGNPDVPELLPATGKDLYH